MDCLEFFHADRYRSFPLVKSAHDTTLEPSTNYLIRTLQRITEDPGHRFRAALLSRIIIEHRMAKGMGHIRLKTMGDGAKVALQGCFNGQNEHIAKMFLRLQQGQIGKWSNPPV